MLWIYILIATLTGATIHSARASLRGDGNRAVELFLVYLLVGYYGLAMILSGLVHLLNPAPLAVLKGWPVSQPMHALYSFALFGLAVSASLSIWFRGKYLLAPAISGSVLAFGGAYVHGAEMVNRGSFLMARDGPEILFDVLVPFTILTLAGRHALREKDAEDEILPEYDFSGGVRGKHAARYSEGTNLVLLEPDVAKAFWDSAAVNAALRQYLSEHGTPPPAKTAG